MPIPKVEMMPVAGLMAPFALAWLLADAVGIELESRVLTADSVQLSKRYYLRLCLGVCRQ